MNHLVVARYSESVDWTARLQGHWAVHIVHNGVHRPNFGREAGAYLWWLSNWWSRLSAADTVAMVQGDPFDHCPDVLTRIDSHRAGYMALTDMTVECDRDGGPHHPGLAIGVEFDRVFPSEAWPDPYRFHAHGQFVTPAGAFLDRGFAFWNDIHHRLEEDSLLPYKLERLWERILR